MLRRRAPAHGLPYAVPTRESALPPSAPLRSNIVGMPPAGCQHPPIRKTARSTGAPARYPRWRTQLACRFKFDTLSCKWLREFELLAGLAVRVDRRAVHVGKPLDSCSE